MLWGVSENRGPQYSTLNSRIDIIRTQDKVPPIFGNYQIGFWLFQCFLLDFFGLFWGAEARVV